MGYDRCPYLSFFVTGTLKDKTFKSMGRRDLNTKYTIFDKFFFLRKMLKMWCYEYYAMNVCDASMNAKTTKMTRLGIEQNRRIPEFFKEMDPTLLGANTGLLGNKLIGFTYYRYQDSLMKR